MLLTSLFAYFSSLNVAILLLFHSHIRIVTSDATLTSYVNKQGENGAVHMRVDLTYIVA